LEGHILRARYNSLKTIGPRTAQLLTELHERRRSTFTLEEVREITGLNAASARSLVQKARNRGLVTRLKPGLFNLVPFELGRATEHVDHPYLIAKELAGTSHYFLSHGTALELHRMTTQPNLTIFVSSNRRIRPQRVGGYDYRFVLVSKAQIFGITQVWITKEQSVAVSDPERTIIDGLRQPDYAGGVTELSKGLWMRRDKLDVECIIGYALKLNVGAVFRRLGYLLELYGIADSNTLGPLRDRLTSTYQRLDPLLPSQGPYFSRWRLQLNIESGELDAVRRT
jgi:predicted transcriptional regulator of viral defense system